MPSKARRTLRLTILALAALLASGASLADEKAAKPATPPTRDELVAAARKVMTSQTYCALITLDASGRPSVRTMNPFPPEDDLTVWFATNDRSRKVAEMRANPRVTLYYADHAKASGYVSLSGRAVLVDDKAEILKRKRAYWDTSFPGLKNLVLVKVVPEKLDVLNYEGKIVVDPVTWRTPSIDVGPVTATP